MLARRRERNAEKRRQREQQKKEKEFYEKMMADWKVKRDDLECDDLLGLPPPTVVSTRIPSELFGDAVMAMEFCNNFAELLDLQEFFPYGLDFETMEEALFDRSPYGAFLDLMKILLQTVFALQIEEDKPGMSQNDAEMMRELQISDAASDDGQDDDNCNVALRKAILESTPQTYFGQPLSEVELSYETITEVLRLHLLSSGSPKLRSVHRGWFSSREDAGLLLRVDHPELFKSLTTTSIVDLDVGDRLILINCLINQIMSFSRYREYLDDGECTHT